MRSRRVCILHVFIDISNLYAIILKLSTGSSVFGIIRYPILTRENLMKNIVENIKSRRIAHLEQTCERYATMVYEVLRRRLAMGFKSITYSYEGSEADEYSGTFTATLVPWEQTNKYRHGHRSTQIKFNVRADPDGVHWHLSGGTATDIESGMEMTIQFPHSIGRVVITIPEWDEIRYASNADHRGEDSVFEISAGQEPWGNFYDSITV